MVLPILSDPATTLTIVGLVITSRNARFQQWQALLSNRNKRQRAGEFVVQGVRPINLAVRFGWEIRAFLHRRTGQLSAWARDLLDTVDTTRVAMADDLLTELGEQVDVPELVAVVAQRPDDRARLRPGLVVVFDRPGSPGNLGTLIRSADAFGATGMVVTGHATDVYDPRTVRASTGSLFSIPVVRLDRYQAEGLVVGLDESGTAELAELDLRGPLTLVVGNEAQGMSAAWRAACAVTGRIPIGGAASSLNAAAAGSIALYEVARQRRG